MFKKKIEILSMKHINLESAKTSSYYIGKKVFSKLGNQIGIVKNIVLKNNLLAGFIVVGRKTIFIDKEYIDSESEKALMLSMHPVTELIGKQVFDKVGRKLGKVISLERKTNTNNFTNLIIKANIYSKPFKVPKEHVSAYKENIILNKDYEGV